MGGHSGDSPPMGRPSGRSRVSHHRRPSRSLARCSKPGARRGAFGCGPVYAKLLLPEAGAAGGRRQGSQGPPTAPKPHLHVQQALLSRQPKISWVVGRNLQKPRPTPKMLPASPRSCWEIMGLMRCCRTKNTNWRIDNNYTVCMRCANYALTVGAPQAACARKAPTKRPLGAH